VLDFLRKGDVLMVTHCLQKSFPSNPLRGSPELGEGGVNGGLRTPARWPGGNRVKASALSSANLYDSAASL
jgi:hypothetical protein